MAARLGITLQADEQFLALNRQLIEDSALVELFEINPETLWQAECAPSPLHRLFCDLVQRAGRPVVGHGILYSLGAAIAPPRRRAWLDALRRDQEIFAFEWYSEHLGFADHGDRHAALPLPLPADAAAAAVVADNMTALADLFPTTAFENNVGYFALGVPMAEPDLFRHICATTGTKMVLDLHNAYTTCLNFGLDLDAWLARVPWQSVIEIHLSGGSSTDPAWFACARSFRLDTHDGPVPEPVWHALATALPRCTDLRAVIVEWLPDGMDRAAAGAFAADVERARDILTRSTAGAWPPVSADPVPTLPTPCPDLAGLQGAILDCCTADDPASALTAARTSRPDLNPWLRHTDADGLRLTALLVKKLRFERILRGSAELAARFEAGPAPFTAIFRRYLTEVPPTAIFPGDEAAEFARFLAATSTDQG